jgi:hypothetical protein
MSKPIEPTDLDLALLDGLDTDIATVEDIVARLHDRGVYDVDTVTGVVRRVRDRFYMLNGLCCTVKALVLRTCRELDEKQHRAAADIAQRANRLCTHRARRREAPAVEVNVAPPAGPWRN